MLLHSVNINQLNHFPIHHCPPATASCSSQSSSLALVVSLASHRLLVLFVLYVFRVLRVLNVLHVSLVSLVSPVFLDLLNIWKKENHSLPDLKSRDRKRCDHIYLGLTFWVER